MSKECAEVFFKILKFVERPQPALNPFTQLILYNLLLIALVDQEDAGVVALMSDAPTNYLIDLPNSCHLIPVVSCYLLVVPLPSQPQNLILMVLVLALLSGNRIFAFQCLLLLTVLVKKLLF